MSRPSTTPKAHDAPSANPLDSREARLRVMRAGRALREAMHKTLAPVCKRHGITVQQLDVLAELAACESASITGISRAAGVRRTNFALVCRKMERLGLLERRRNETDRRSFAVAITPAGRSLVDEVDGEVAAFVRAALTGAPEGLFDDVARGLAALEELSRRIEGAASPETAASEPSSAKRADRGAAAPPRGRSMPCSAS